MKNLYLIFIVFLISCSADLRTPLQENNYNSVTSYEELIKFVDDAVVSSNLISSKILCESAEGRDIPYFIISNGNFGEDTSKIKVMIFASQHGNEQSGKEGALMLISEIAEGKVDYLFNKIDLIVIPNMNPDATEKDKRINANDYDLNRNHLILTESETTGLHKLFNQYMPEATLDVHEYNPYSKSWIEFGYLKFFDEQFGTLTNSNVSEDIIAIQKKDFLPFIKSYLNNNGFTFNEYVLDGPPNKYKMRYSTVDINDGRQSFGILNSFSFIVEGRNAENTLDDMQHRASGQKTAIKGYLEFIYNNKDKIKSTIICARHKLATSEPGEMVHIWIEHVQGDSPVELNLKSVSTNRDSVIIVEDYHSKVKPLLSVTRPLGYLIPKSDEVLVELLYKHNFKISENPADLTANIYRYEILSIGKKTEEGDEIKYPELNKSKLKDVDSSKYIFVPTKQLAANLIVTAFEPGSMLGLAQYKDYSYLLENKYFPILRVE